jgi:hypothetical protein
VASRKCEQCGATVAADEQFCPTCGAFMDPLEHGERPPHVISVSSSGYEEFDLSQPPPPAEPPKRRVVTSSEQIQCPSCGAANPSNNRHCEECGARLSQAPLPTAPRPAVQATAGVRAALAISGLLFTVVIGALLFNFLGGDDDPSTTTVASTSTTAPPAVENAAIPVLDEQCSVEGISTFSCGNLTSGTTDEYQLNWEELPEDQDVVIRLIFDQPMIIQQIQWTGIADADRFEQNYRPRGLIISASDAITDFQFELEDVPGGQTIPYVAVGANWVEFTVTSAYFATPVGDNVFKDMAIDEITVIGRPQAQQSAGETTSTTGTTTP